ncbi:hypothetical protein E2562_001478 [Oryza meyeriana var. granulata]|uniref:Uncharacterized protein n=1 Tax=Oryza meyeriana var. granulata TaxID=110450 RepID=A0A6G1DDP1_9ORYZ|nr:hypothetical protein E2562_001478 [Oryza meyeriana var. granulata]
MRHDGFHSSSALNVASCRSQRRLPMTSKSAAVPSPLRLQRKKKTKEAESMPFDGGSDHTYVFNSSPCSIYSQISAPPSSASRLSASGLPSSHLSTDGLLSRSSNVGGISFLFQRARWSVEKGKRSNMSTVVRVAKDEGGQARGGRRPEHDAMELAIPCRPSILICRSGPPLQCPQSSEEAHGGNDGGGTSSERSASIRGVKVQLAFPLQAFVELQGRHRRSGRAAVEKWETTSRWRWRRLRAGG